MLVDEHGWTRIRESPSSLGGALVECSKPAEAERYLRESLDLHQALGEYVDLPGIVVARKRLADALAKQGKFGEAAQSYRDAISAYRKYNGPVTDEFRATVNYNVSTAW
jgi:tetratricopeptide (TPR) repeat protein